MRQMFLYMRNMHAAGRGAQEVGDQWGSGDHQPEALT
jgi:hypothetical protein